MTKTTFDAGELVLCDLCDRDGDEKNDDGSPKHLGGLVVAGYAVCPVCEKDIVSAKESESKIVKLDPEKSFGENIRWYRTAMYGNPNLIMELLTGNDLDEVMGGNNGQ